MEKISGQVTTKEKYDLVVKNSTTKYIFFARKIISDNMKYFLDSEFEVAKEDIVFRGSSDDIDWDDLKNNIRLSKAVYKGEHGRTDNFESGAFLDLYFETTKKSKVTYSSRYPITIGFEIDSSLTPRVFYSIGTI